MANTRIVKTMILFRAGLCPSAGKSTGPEAKRKGVSCPIVHPNNSQAFLWGVGARRDHDSRVGPLLPMLLMHFTNDSLQQNAKFVFEETAFWSNCKTIWDIGRLEDLSCLKEF